MIEVLQLVHKIAKSSCPALILGESGTGKELIASAMHRLSDRARFPFVTINCSAIPENLLEAELFGYEKGAFTGADRKKIGHFGTADQGTIFLDEIGDMPITLQSKILRVLQEKQITPVGSCEVKHVDVRVIAATNIDIEQAIKGGRFRLDLYYRLNVLPVHLPPLRFRREDIEQLLDYFFKIANRINSHKKPCWLLPETILFLEGYHWPGNIRQLQNLVDRLSITMEGAIRTCDLPNEFQVTDDIPTPPRTPKFEEEGVPAASTPVSTTMTLPEQGLDLAKLVWDLENTLIEQALIRTKNNKNQAAKLLRLNRTTLVERLKKRNIQAKE